MDAPCLPSPEPKSEKFNATRVDLNGTMCFSLDKKPPCIWLRRKNLTNWIDPLVHSKIGINILNEALSQVASGTSQGSGPGSNASAINVTTLAM